MIRSAPKWSAVRSQIASLEKDTAEKLQLLDILRFQVNEIQVANLQPDDVHFAARCLGPAPQLEQESKEQRHLLAVCSRARIEPLRRELARRGRKVVHVLPARLARLSFACQQLTSHPNFVAQSSAIVIDVESGQVK